LIDQATGCQTCGGALGDSPSGDFCQPLCQQRWHETRAELFEGYESAEHEGFDGLGWLFDAILGPSPRGDGPPHTRTFTLRDPDTEEGHQLRPSYTVIEFDTVVVSGFGEALAAAMERLSAAGRAAAESARGLAEQLDRHQLPPDPQERALELRRRRNTGPQQRQRAPRRINPRGSL